MKLKPLFSKGLELVGSVASAGASVARVRERLLGALIIILAMGTMSRSFMADLVSYTILFSIALWLIAKPNVGVK